MKHRLAIITSHPIQYYAPWFRWLARDPDIALKVFYLWDFGVRPTHDPGFGKSFVWDIPLLEGYDYTFIPNTSADPGTHHLKGLSNPDLATAVLDWQPEAVLMIGYAYDSFLRWLLHIPGHGIPLLLKGDSHRLVPEKSLKRKVKDFLISLLFRKFSAFLYCGEANRQYFRKKGIPERRLFFSPHAVDLERFQKTGALADAALEWRKTMGIGSENNVILFAGKFEEKKKPLDLLEAYLQVRTPLTRLVFAGAGPLENALKEKASAFPDILFSPMLNQSEMPALYNAADLFVLPSFGPDETWGLAVQESLACGTPVVVSSHVGCHLDLVQNKNNGIVFEAGSLISLEKSLETALQPGILETWRAHCHGSLEHYTYGEATSGLKKALEFLKA